MINKLTKVPIVIPEISVIDMGRCSWVPMSFPHSMGTRAKMVVKLVINIGFREKGREKTWRENHREERTGGRIKVYNKNSLSWKKR